MEGGWWRLCELEESCKQESLPPCQTSWFVPLAVCNKSRNTKRKKGAGCKVLDSNLCTPVSRSREQQIKGKMLQFGWMQAFVEVTLTVVYHSGQSQSGQSHWWAWQSIIDMSPRPQGGVNGLCWNTPNCYFDILWPMLHKILQSILFLNSFANAIFLIGSILSVFFDSYGNFWIIDEGRGSLRSWAWPLEQRKLDLLFRRHRDNKEVKWQGGGAKEI